MVIEDTEIGFLLSGDTDNTAAMPCATGCNIHEHGLCCRSVSPGHRGSNFNTFRNSITSMSTKVCNKGKAIPVTGCGGP
jgi:hypothetical protein